MSSDNGASVPAQLFGRKPLTLTLIDRDPPTRVHVTFDGSWKREVLGVTTAQQELERIIEEYGDQHRVSKNVHGALMLLIGGRKFAKAHLGHREFLEYRFVRLDYDTSVRVQQQLKSEVERYGRMIAYKEGNRRNEKGNKKRKR